MATETPPADKWVYRMQASADDKKYSTDTRLFKDAVMQDGIFDKFESSPIIDQVQMKDICIYAPGDLNKVGKEGRTSWDSFTYAIMMGHNVWMHINAVQEANRQSDLGCIPAMMDARTLDKPRDYSPGPNKFKDIVDLIFSMDNREDAMAIVEHYEGYFDRIIGTRGNTGDKITNAGGMAAVHFEIEGNLTIEKVVKEQPKPVLNESLFEF